MQVLKENTDLNVSSKDVQKYTHELRKINEKLEEEKKQRENLELEKEDLLMKIQQLEWDKELSADQFCDASGKHFNTHTTRI
jgi:chromosome segregation ATPase